MSLKYQIIYSSMEVDCNSNVIFARWQVPTIHTVRHCTVSWAWFAPSIFLLCFGWEMLQEKCRQNPVGILQLSTETQQYRTSWYLDGHMYLTNQKEAREKQWMRKRSKDRFVSVVGSFVALQFLQGNSAQRSSSVSTNPKVFLSCLKSNTHRQLIYSHNWLTG